MPYPILDQIIEQTTSRVPDKMQKGLDAAIMAGLKIMHDKSSHSMMLKHIEQEGDMAENIGEGVAKLVGILWNDSQGKLPLQIMIPAGVVLVCKAAEFVGDAGMFEITNESIGEAVQEYASSFMQLLGVTPEKLQGMMQVAEQEEAKKQGGMQQGQPPQPGGIIAAAQE